MELYDDYIDNRMTSIDCSFREIKIEEREMKIRVRLVRRDLAFFVVFVRSRDGDTNNEPKFGQKNRCDEDRTRHPASTITKNGTPLKSQGALHSLAQYPAHIKQ